MQTQRSIQLEKEIRYLESQYAYTNSMVALLMAEGNLIDIQIETFTKSGLNLSNQLRDLKAELKDTI